MTSAKKGTDPFFSSFFFSLLFSRKVTATLDQASEVSCHLYTSPPEVDNAQAFSDFPASCLSPLKKGVRPLFLVILASLCWLSGLRFAPAAEKEKPSLERYEASASVMGSTFTVAGYGEDRARLASAVRAAFD